MDVNTRMTTQSHWVRQKVNLSQVRKNMREHQHAQEETNEQ